MSNELNTISASGPEDADRLYSVASSLYTGLIIINWIISVAGLLTGAISLIKAFSDYRYPSGHPIFWFGIVIIIATILFCIALYFIAVYLTHFAKIFVQIYCQLHTNKSSNTSLTLQDRPAPRFNRN